MRLTNGNCDLLLSEAKGSILSYRINGKEVCASGGENRPLFTLKLLDEEGKGIYHTSLEAQEVTWEHRPDGCTIRYRNIAGSLDAAVQIEKKEENGFGWNLQTENNTGLRLEWQEFPQITVPNRLKGDGGEYELFWPAMEGVLIGTTKRRAASQIPYEEIGGQSGSFGGFYPGSCPMQFMAFYDGEKGLYFAAHDGKHHPKTVEFREAKDGIALEFRLFTEGRRGSYAMDFDMVTAGFAGDWHDGAQLYRSWMEKNVPMPQKLLGKSELPSWMEQSPVVMLYPIRGTVDHGDMTPNLYYPYRNILPFAEKYARETDSRLLVLPMHWEGTAPWAPPYVWPPFGGEQAFTEFVEAVHEQGNLVGVYCSGIGWTVKSTLDPSLDLSDRYDESLICRTPAGTIEQSRVIGDEIRYGLDMCPWQEKVDRIVSDEIVSIAESGCDYAQYFDQNLGGQGPLCYGEEHGHPGGPGLWQNEAMIRIFQKVREDLKKAGRDLVIGCECACAEPFIEWLPFNDLRYNFAFFAGKPVPAYAYLFHEYVNNFMGNQCIIHEALAPEKNKDSALFRLAYSFVAGDMLTITLGDRGLINWGWDVPWDAVMPKQEPILTLIRELNAWRRTYERFLHKGRMVKPYVLEGVEDYTLYLCSGGTEVYPALLTSRWQDGSGECRQVIVNFLPHEQQCSVEHHTVYTSPKEEGRPHEGLLRIPPLRAVWIS